MSLSDLHLDYETKFEQCIEYAVHTLHKITNRPEDILKLHPITRRKLYTVLKKYDTI